MKDLFKLIIALPFLGFQAGGSVVLGCLGFIFYTLGALVFLGSCYYLFITFGKALQGDVYSIKYFCFLILLAIGTNLITDLYFKIKAKLFTED